MIPDDVCLTWNVVRVLLSPKSTLFVIVVVVSVFDMADRDILEILRGAADQPREALKIENSHPSMNCNMGQNPTTLPSHLVSAAM